MVNYLSKTYFYIRKLHISRNYYKQNYYDVLKVDRNCSQQQIKTAYLNKTKELHPDKNPNDPNSEAKFILLTEAYEVLSKPYTRRLYDKHLDNFPNSKFDLNFTQKTRQTAYSEGDKWRDESIWEMRDRSKDAFYEEKPYYGIKGLKRIPNYSIALACLIVMVFGMIGHYVAFKYGRGSALERLDQKNRAVMKAYEDVRRRAHQPGGSEQIKKMQEKCARNVSDEGE